jgi:putative ABC transport system permease protein
MDFYTSAILQGLGYVPMAVGIFITLRIFNIPDITTDGSFTLGAAVTALFLVSGWGTAITLPAVLISGALAGTATGLIHTKLRVHPLLSGILVMTALYSVNLLVMGRSNIPFAGVEQLFDGTQSATLYLIVFALVTGIFIVWLLRTDFGLAMRATGSSERMIRALGVNTDAMKITGLALANALTAMSGFLVAQFQSFADINMGIGIVISGLAAVMIGESLMKLFRSNATWLVIFFVIAGSVVFRLILAFVLSRGLDPNYLKLVTALLVLMVLMIVAIKRPRA